MLRLQSIADSLSTFSLTICVPFSVQYKNLFRPTTIAKFGVHSRLCRNVGLLRVFPSITTETVSVSVSVSVSMCQSQTATAAAGQTGLGGCDR